MEPRSARESLGDRRLAQLDALRGVAALTVITSHLLASMPQWHTSQNARWFEMSPGNFLIAGRAAVAVFFVLSGFVLALPYVAGRPPAYGPYLVKRFFRIWIPYVVAVGVAFVGFLLLANGPVDGASHWFNKHWAEPLTLRRIVQHVLLIGVFDAGQYGMVFWTLVHEMRVSILFPLIMWPVMRWRADLAMLPTLMLSLVGALILRSGGGGVVGSTALAVTLVYLPLFTLGALIARYKEQIVSWYQSRTPGQKVAVALAAYVLTFHAWIVRDALGSDGLAEAAEYWTMMIGGALGIVFLIAVPSLIRLFNRRSLVWLGDISYSLYVFHAIVLYAVLHAFHSVLPLNVLFVLSVPLSFAIAVLSHRFVEVPAMSLGRSVAARISGVDHTVPRLRPSPVPRGAGTAELGHRVA